MTDPVFSEADQAWMEAALDLARRAESDGEVPVGAVVVRDGALLGEGRNRNIGGQDPSAHAEIMAMRAAGRAAANHRLPGCDLYVTLEPCAMCVGAAIHARIRRIVFAARDPKTGALGGSYDLQEVTEHNHRLEVSGGLLEEAAAKMLREFFARRRQGRGQRQAPE
ncbi:MAG: tRNA adenosine(34) deaminase TadA [Xanthomonadales bacterium]|nr:tRNA adenosine(34) deaminase TadA [Xanthomonadales bacterium]